MQLYDKVKQLTEETREAFQAAGISVSASKGAHDIHMAAGYADAEEKWTAAADSVYCIGSSTKAFIATALCILAEEKRLNLDDPVKNYLPWFRMYDDYSTAHLTVRDMLSHRSGLPRHDTSWLNTPYRTMKEQVEALSDLQPAWELRYRFHYQNHMFMAATLVVEQVSKMAWGDFVRERILQPLHMDSTFIYGDEITDTDHRKAKPYLLRENTWVRMPYNYMKSAGGAGTMYSTTVDMLKWLKFRLHGNPEILGDKLRKEMHTLQMVICPGEMVPVEFPEVWLIGYGLGWFIESYRGHKVIHHGGTVEGFKSEQIFVPEEDIAVSILCNLNQTKAVSALGYKVLDELLGLEPVPWDERYLKAYEKVEKKSREETAAAIQSAKEMADACRNAADYVGSYEHKAYGKAEVTERDGQIFLSMIGLTLPMLATGRDQFHLVVESYEMCFPVSFEREKDGSVRALLIPLEEQLKEPIRFERR